MNFDSDEPILTGEETDALLDVMRQTGPEEQVESLDLTSKEPRLRDALSPADRATQFLAGRVRRLVLRTAGCSANVEAQPAEIIPYRVMRDAIAPGAAIATLTTQTDRSRGLLILGPNLVSFLLDRRLGAPLRLDTTEAAAGPSDARKTLSPVDKRVMRPITSDISKLFGESWCEDRNDFEFGELLERSELPEIDTYESLLRFAVRVTPLGAPADDLIVVLSPEATLSTMPKQEDTTVNLPSIEERYRMAENLHGTDLSLVAVLGEVRSDIRNVLGLRKGDIVRLDSVPSQPTPICSEGIAVLYGDPCIHHGNLAIAVTAVHTSKMH